VVTNLLFDRVGLYPDTPARQEILEGLYRRNYTKATAAFRPEAREVIERLVASGLPVWVVTNSDTDAVTDKINLLAPVGKESLEIRGNAKKYVVSEPADPDPTFDAVPEERRLEGLDRPIFLRRGHYYQLLREIWTVTGTSPERTIVAGDIYELDLALPAALGVAVHLLARDTTPEHEKRAVVADGGQVSDQLYAVLERVGIPA
jgi:FMN phosphatase YigB (HAD superfamily)